MKERYSKARFWKCALQVNPAGYIRYRGEDHGLCEDEYNRKLLEICKKEGVKIIGLADHGNVECIDGMRNLFNENGILVFPGFEIASSEKVHFVCLFPEDTTKSKLERYLGSMDLLDPEDGVRPSRLSAEKIFEKVKDIKGFIYAAHVTDEHGILHGKFNHAWKNPLLEAAQIPGTLDNLANEEFYPYWQILLNNNPAYKREKKIAVINAKDVARPEDLENPKASCLIKMTKPDFQSFKAAFLDPESRVRLNSDMSEEYYSKILEARFSLGYLDGIEIDFSDHLNTVIGGRGTGKSTILECIRYVLAKTPESKGAKKQHEEIIKENIGRNRARIELKVYSYAKRNEYTISRRYGDPPIVRDKSGTVSSFIPGDILPTIEIFGQNEIYEIAREEDLQLKLIERFLPPEASEIEEKLAEVNRKLDENKEKLIKARSRLDDFEEEIKKLPKLEEEAQQYKKMGLEEKLKKIPLLEREKNLKDRVVEEIASVEKALQSFVDNLPDTTFLGEGAISLLPHRDILTEIKTVLDDLKKDSLPLAEGIEKILSRSRADLDEKIESLLGKIKDEEESIQKAFKDLPSADGRSGNETGIAYQALLKRIETIKPLRDQAESQEKFLAEIRMRHRNLLADLSDIRALRTEKLQRTVNRLNRKLKGKLRLNVSPEGNRNELKKFLLGCNLEGIAEKRLSWIDSATELSPITLAGTIREGKEALLDANWGMTAFAAEALTKLHERQLLDLEKLSLPDVLSIELNVAHEGEQFKPLDRLSTGQQCTAILQLLLLENFDPLVMDQPEDNLDNAFIAKRIVSELRISKTRRQFIFATHNANIPVFGDAEWIGVITASRDGAFLPFESQGAVDVPEIKKQATDILEGGRDAFKQRMLKYGIS